MDLVKEYALLGSVIAAFVIHFIWSFRLFRWLFAWKYDSPFGVFVSRFCWSLVWTFLTVVVLWSIISPTEVG